MQSHPCTTNLIRFGPSTHVVLHLELETTCLFAIKIFLNSGLPPTCNDDTTPSHCTGVDDVSFDNPATLDTPRIGMTTTFPNGPNDADGIGLGGCSEEMGRVVKDWTAGTVGIGRRGSRVRRAAETIDFILVYLRGALVVASCMQSSCTNVMDVK